MILLRRSTDRGHANHGWLDSHHTFSFGGYHDPEWMGFGPLRVINEDRVAAGGGFAPHSHANMEIISYVIDGALQHRDSLGTGSVIRPGDVQCMSAGSGIEHSEFNASQTEPVHFLQVWIQPDRLNAKPRYGQVHFSPASRHGVLRLVASPDGADGALAIRQDARMYASLLAPGETVQLKINPERRVWVQVVSGVLRLDDETQLGAGDAAGISAQAGPLLRAESDSEVLVFDLP
jgi:redox-sensitive bicupin YhaK (pirin superfamily)